MPAVRILIPLILGFAAGGACGAELPGAQRASVTDLASLREGVFTTAPADAGTGAKPPARVLYQLAKRVDVPALGRDVVYAELREGAQDGRIVRQSLYALKLDEETGRVVMTAYSFGDPQSLAGLSADATPLAKLSPSDLKPQTPGCDILWRKMEDGFGGDYAPGCKGAPSTAGGAKDPRLTVSKTGLVEPPEPSSPTVVFRRLL